MDVFPTTLHIYLINVTLLTGKHLMNSLIFGIEDGKETHILILDLVVESVLGRFKKCLNGNAKRALIEN